MRIAHVTSSHGLKDGVAFDIDAGTGRVLRAYVNISEFGEPPARFDVDEYRKMFGKVPDVLDILEIGYVLFSGKVVEPDKNYRLWSVGNLCHEAADLITEMAAALRQRIDAVARSAGSRTGDYRSVLCDKADKLLPYLLSAAASTSWEKEKDDDKPRDSDSDAGGDR